MIERVEDRLGWFPTLEYSVGGVIHAQTQPRAYATFGPVVVGHHSRFVNISPRITFSPAFFEDYERLLRSYERDLRSNFHPQGTIPEDIMIHELMHALEFYLVTRNHNVQGNVIESFELFFQIVDEFMSSKISEAITYEAIENINNRRISNGLEPKTPFDIKNDVAGYAAVTDETGRVIYAETFATALTDFFANGNNARELSIEMAQIVREMLVR